VSGSLNELGCGFYTAQIWTKGGEDLVFDGLPVTDVEWSRVLSDTGDAQASLAGLGLNVSCFEAIRDGSSWSHELALIRTSGGDGSGELVWQGPLVGKSSKFTTGGYKARDLSAWWDRRVITLDQTFTQIEVATIFNAIALDADEQDPFNLTTDATPIGVTATRVYRAGNYLPAGPELRELTKTGIDWTIIGREALVGGLVVPADPIVFLQDDHLREAPQVDEDGMQFSNDVIVSGAGGGEQANPVVGRATDLDSVATYGLNTTTVQNDSIRDSESAAAYAQSRLALLKVPSVVMGDVSLRPSAPVLVSQLIPGSVVSCAFQTSGIPVAGQFRLQKVSAKGVGTGEIITLSLQPLGSGGEDS